MQMKQFNDLKPINIMGTEYLTTFTKAYEKRTNWVKNNPKHICSYIPGTILEIKVKEGMVVKEGQEILILESMKMANKIKSPANGTIKVIHVTSGDRIPKGFLMFELV